MAENVREKEIWRQMMSGEPYDATNPDLVTELNRVKLLLQNYNNLPADDASALDATIRGILGGCKKRLKVLQPFLCDYGCNIVVGENFFANFNLTILDEAPVTMGDNVFIGPNVGIYTACHPLDPAERNMGIEWCEPVTIGDNCWIGGGVTILPGVTIGSNVTIGGGSVVSRDIPDNCVAVGNPCRVIKTLDKI